MGPGDLRFDTLPGALFFLGEVAFIFRVPSG